jgi:hypothetical protein
VFKPNRYNQSPDPGSGPGAGPGITPNPNQNLNVNPSFGPFDNLNCITFSQVNLVNEMRYLWLQLVIWSRAYIKSSSIRHASAPVFYERLYSVPTGFYNYMNLFFGQAIAEQFINLLSQHIIIFAGLISAMNEGNQQEANSRQSDWYGNANSISSFLAQINNTWNLNQWQNLLNRYLEMMLTEAVAIMSSNYRNEIAIYDRLQYQSLLTADYMSRGVMESLRVNINNQAGWEIKAD